MNGPRILVTNDDGIFSEGIERLAEALSAVGDVYTVAPDQERSAAGHALTLDTPLRTKEIAEKRWSVNGTPTDCVNWGVLYLLRDARPELLFSGINLGLNLGDDVTYSGTVSAAFEGALLGIPSVAISQEIERGFSFDAAAEFASRLARRLLEQPLPPKTLVNVNVPAGSVRGVRVGRLGTRRYGETVIEKRDPRGRPYYWIGSTLPVGEFEEGTDVTAVAEKFISMTPVHLDLTAYQSMELLQTIATEMSTPESVEAAPRPRERF
ncbi:MAG TPA: 5'/3'-nucleotidase SurE [Thermoanaerobaculia bacterium]|nr:5'/3'-nucleotidase SurE [Thermoanaerobaculia bacterium]